MRISLQQLFALIAGCLATTAAAAAPPNDNFSNAETITGSHGNANGTNLEATTEPGENFSGSNSIWYNWIAPSDGTFIFDTIGSGFDTVLSALTGDELRNLSTRSVNDNGASGVESSIVFRATAGTLYRIRIATHTPDDTHSTVLNWRLAAVPVNDDFANPTALTGPSGSLRGDNVLATTESRESAPGARSVWFTWTAPFTGTVQFDTLGSLLFTRLLVGTGDSLENLSVLGENRQSSASSTSGTSRLLLPVTSGVTYRIRISTDYFWGGDNYVLNWAEVPNYVPNVISFGRATYTVDESGPVAVITLNRTFGTDTGRVTVRVSLAGGGTAEFGSDFYYFDFYENVAFESGATVGTFTLPIVDDLLFEKKETVRLALTNPSETASLGAATATVAIIDNDPIIPVKAFYSGIIEGSDSDGVFVGKLNIQTSRTGAFTGSLALNGVRYAITGSFNARGRATVQIPREDSSPLALALSYGGANLVDATLSDGSTSESFPTFRAIYSARAPFGTEDTLFTAPLMSDRSGSADIPQGDGFLLLRVTPNGLVRLRGCLADGTPVAAGGRLVRADEHPFVHRYPLHLSLYGGRGSLSGDVFVSLDKDADSRTASYIRWLKAPKPLPGAFKEGFEVDFETTLLQYRYRLREPMFVDLTYSENLADFVAGFGGLSEDVTQRFVLTEANTIHLPTAPAVQLTLTIKPTTGFFSGTFQLPGGEATPFKGAIYRDRSSAYDYGSGFFRRRVNGVVTSGFVEIYAASPY